MNKSELVKIALVSTLIWCGGYGAAKADTAMLSASEVEALMSGNSIWGTFPDGVTEYKQNNHPDGVAVVVVKDDKIRNIPWSVKEEGGIGQYCEDWSAEGWGEFCYRVTREVENMPIFITSDGGTNQNNWAAGYIDLNFD